jgi:hypothetical protein
MTTHLLFNLKIIHDWGKFAENFIGLLVEFQLRGDQVGKVSKWLRGIENLASVLASHLSSG